MILSVAARLGAGLGLAALLLQPGRCLPCADETASTEPPAEQTPPADQPQQQTPRAVAAEVAVARQAAPEGYAAFTPKQLKLQPGVKLFRPTREIYIVGGSLQAAVGDQPPGNIDDEKLATYFAAVTTADQARELCELLNWGTHLEGEKDFASLIELYRTFGIATPPDPTIQRRFGDQVSEAESGGFDVAFTLFRLGRGMGAQAQVGRFELHVNPDASVSWDKADIYLTGPLLNWQSCAPYGETDAEIAARMAAEKAVETNRNRLIDEVFNRFARPTVLAAAAKHPQREVVGPVGAADQPAIPTVIATPGPQPAANPATQPATSTTAPAAQPAAQPEGPGPIGPVGQAAPRQPNPTPGTTTAIDFRRWNEFDPPTADQIWQRQLLAEYHAPAGVRFADQGFDFEQPFTVVDKLSALPPDAHGTVTIHLDTNTNAPYFVHQWAYREDPVLPSAQQNLPHLGQQGRQHVYQPLPIINQPQPFVFYEPREQVQVQAPQQAEIPMVLADLPQQQELAPVQPPLPEDDCPDDTATNDGTNQADELQQAGGQQMAAPADPAEDTF